ncbi:H-type small acid-soluble spore protein [Paenibacillus aurantius]|uniref:H-type small acid-soluble spore protein n=1 Tax=Paenibacillus aurantius TaxID=2918900 RepID=A0AA96RCE7_9BACL|nr:H-type small acid-soluble spore protein [Paenibacillus aurantius]WJH35183.1 H-type small acid-soluble spore protein [Paenibacillus sp. CC-CFT747]WNQ10450.1 H-type small acid-soluble spore protein [Paenibacillus aurantius]
MDITRAQEILQASERITVEMNGVPVWIDSVDRQGNKVKVHAESNPADTRTVSVEELDEVH